MFLSDELIEMGSNANPKSNMEQGHASILMHRRLKEEARKGIPEANLINSTKFALKELVKRGFTYYTIDVFFMPPYCTALEQSRTLL